MSWTSRRARRIEAIQAASSLHQRSLRIQGRMNLRESPADFVARQQRHACTLPARRRGTLELARGMGEMDLWLALIRQRRGRGDRARVEHDGLDQRIVEQVSHVDHHPDPFAILIAHAALTCAGAGAAAGHAFKNFVDAISIIGMHEKEHGLSYNLPVRVTERGMDHSQEHHFGRYQQYPLLIFLQKGLENMNVRVNGFFEPLEAANLVFLNRNPIEKIAN